eukprot:CAMPEP_0197863990 /NCGR_PEP_ID=MMETSP1438-20131217/41829_1 /TAXON_ID=1461541 /ORGANISM="Pterosperma sp., Strain CCMP1384" /LENGTH=74 /DNA_ID=CAMNT_0043482061 /DNA_START=523 /DNA_END=747 /DNA_ORIENTATION=+
MKEASNLIDCIADSMWCSVCACMQTQHKIQLEDRDLGSEGVPITNAPTAPVMPGRYVNEPVHGAVVQGIPVSRV